MNAYEIRLKLLDVAELMTNAEQTIRHLEYDNSQQAKRIEELESKFDHFESWEEGYQACKNDMNNQEPVAWMLKPFVKAPLDEFFEHIIGTPDWQIEEFKESYMPLYTHPHKELSDVDIGQIFAEQTGYYIDSGILKGLAIIDFAKAIIKASRGEE